MNRNLKKYLTFSYNWKYKGGNYDLPYKFPVKRDETLTITNRLPKTLNRSEVIWLRTIEQDLRVFANDKLVYEYLRSKKKRVDKYIHSKWHFISLEGIEEDAIIRLEFTSPYKEYTGEIDSIWYGPIKVILLHLSKGIIVNLTISFIAILSGIYILIIKFITNNHWDKSFMYLGFLFIAFGFLSLIDAGSILLLVFSVNIREYIKVFSLMVMPMIFLLYSKEKYDIRKSIAYKLQITIYLISFILGFILQLLGITEFIQLIPLMMYLMIITTIYIVYIVFFKEKLPVKYRIIYGYGFTILIFCIVKEIIMYTNNEFYFLGMYAKSGGICFLFSQLIVALVKLSDELREEKIINTQLEEFRIKFMSRQMESHFFSNVLITIQDLCYTEPELAADTIALFYSYLRGNMNLLEQSETISFSYERDYILTYMKIQRICFGEEIEYVEDIKFDDIKIPPLTIQPLIENAFRHGVRKRSGIGVIKLSTFCEAENIFILIEDNGVGFDINKLNDLKLAFSSTRNIIYRLEKLCAAKVNFESEIGVGTRVTIKLPR